MDVPLTEESEMKEKKSTGRQKGGIITMPFILANESFEKVASFGLLPNMIIYLMSDYHTSAALGTIILLIWSAATNLLPIAGAFLSDSLLGRFLTIFLGSIFSLVGMILLWLTTVIPGAKPPVCNVRVPGSCASSTPLQYGLLFLAFMFMSVGAGGVRPCSLAFGADQIDRKDNPKRERVLESFFGWYYATAIVAVLIAFTGIVYIQDHQGWRVGFGIPVVLMFLSTFVFVVAYPLYYNVKVEKSMFTSFCKVISMAWKNRNLTLPCLSVSDTNGKTMPTDTLRFLNKACISRKPEEMSKVCTVEEVEELKALIKVMPLWSSSIMLAVTMNQSSFPVLQANTMDRHITSSFEIPAGSFSFFVIITIMIWVTLYDRVILPLLSKINGQPVYISVKLRMGAGLIFGIMAMVLSGIVEHIRKTKAIEEGFLNDSKAVVNMSAKWLIPQLVLIGLAEALNIIGQTEFYYSEFPKSMSSIASSLYMLGSGVASLLASLILSTVDALTKRGGKVSWISTDINKGHYERYYWLLAILSAVNFFYYVACSRAYGPCADKVVPKGEKIDNSGEHVAPSSS
ncbi:protein NRT1/ PTR FAMILY 1.2-like [Lactuca sativa]|uniref:Uncharacterized protein n=1 Tax=Lactuca sativa TaxID=4236 RepID=A0A9R1WK33_LACSA|nr:protein NRT1/ PTR FAMILY 1.2-like [Lactuca sativa]KAJ0225108.1 hypothetical protein LSAT_V11C100014740 [Lactuca sativa]